MCQVKICYADNSYFEIKDVDYATYASGSGPQKITEEQLLSNAFALRDKLWFHSPNGNACISTEGIRLLQITKM